MTKLLDLLELYLKWRVLPDGKQMKYRCAGLWRLLSVAPV